MGPVRLATRCLRTERGRRSGSAILEGTIVLGVFLTIIFAMLDVGIAVMRENTLAEAARRLARGAIVHGKLAPPEYSEWGPQTYAGHAGDGSEMAEAICPTLVTLEPADVRFELSWPDGDNRTGQRVIAVVEYDHTTTLPFLLGSSPLHLRAESTMRVDH